MATTAETIKNITRKHLEENNGILLGQCVTAVGWIGGTVPDCKNIIEIPMTDVAGPAFAVGAALMGVRPIFVVRYQGFMWYNASSLVNYAAKSKEIWGRTVPVFIRAIGMEGNGVGHTASACIHSIFTHMPGLPVVAPMTPLEYQNVWKHFMTHDDPIYVSEHRRSFTLTEETPDQYFKDADITLIGISAARLNILAAIPLLAKLGIKANVFHQVWLKPFNPPDLMLRALTETKCGIVVDSDFEVAGCSQTLAYELFHATSAKVYAFGLEDRSCGVAPYSENMTPTPEKIVEKIVQILKSHPKTKRTKPQTDVPNLAV